MRGVQCGGNTAILKSKNMDYELLNCETADGNNRMALFSINQVNYKDIIKYPDIDIFQNQTTFLCGESGCGKSTLLKLLNGVVSAGSGTITYKGKPVEEYDPTKLRREVLLVGQSVYLFDGTIRENFQEYYAYRDLSLISDEKIREYLKLCAADFPLTEPCKNMSGGERQRIYIAICMSLMPKVLMMDEPTSALDEKNSWIVMENIKEFCTRNGITLIVVSHNTRLAEAFADRTITFCGGGCR